MIADPPWAILLRADLQLWDSTYSFLLQKISFLTRIEISISYLLSAQHHKFFYSHLCYIGHNDRFHHGIKIAL